MVDRRSLRSRPARSIRSPSRRARAVIWRLGATAGEGGTKSAMILRNLDFCLNCGRSGGPGECHISDTLESWGLIGQNTPNCVLYPDLQMSAPREIKLEVPIEVLPHLVNGPLLNGAASSARKPASQLSTY